MVYDGLGASTHIFWQILSQLNLFHEKDVQTISIIVIPLQNLKSEVKHPQFEIPNEDPE